MDQQQKTKRLGVWVLLCALALRLADTGIPVTLPQNWIPYTETGQSVRFSSSDETFPAHFRESPPPWVAVPEPLCFRPEQALGIALDNHAGLEFDGEALLTRPLDWELAGDAPTVLILHTHTTESYTQPAGDHVETSPYRTLDEQGNMLSIGAAVAEILEENGISVLHDRALHDYPSYSGAYVHARQSTEEILAEYPRISLILDIHRDSLEQNGRQIPLRVETESGMAAQLMMVVGTSVNRQSHRNWQENLALALKLHALLEETTPGLMRPIDLRRERFNQDLSPGALLIEVGTAGNSQAEALTAARLLANAILRLSHGAV